MPSLAEPAFPGDDGRLDPLLAAGFDASTGPDDIASIVGALCDARIFTPVVAIADGDVADGDKQADMAAVLMTGADGRTGLLAFSSLQTMSAWDPRARPVPVYARDAARAALNEGAAAVLLDLGDPRFTVIEGEDLNGLAKGWRLVASPAGHAWIEV